jgi:hypothetical protein
MIKLLATVALGSLINDKLLQPLVWFSSVQFSFVHSPSQPLEFKLISQDPIPEDVLGS